jgi:hypothetical protein
MTNAPMINDVKHPEPGRCKAMVWTTYPRRIYGVNAFKREPVFYQCQRKAIKDGYCAQHYGMKKALP